MKYSLFPVIGKERELPFFNVSIGFNESQYHVTRPEGHWLDQFLYSSHGSGILLTEGKTFKIQPNTVFFLPRCVPHEYYETSENWDTRWITLSGYALDRLLAQMGFKGATVLPVENITPLDTILSRMRNLICTDRVYGNYHASAYTYEFIMEIDCLAHTAPQNTASSVAARLLPVIEYIDANFCSPLTLNELSEIIHVTPQHLCRLFHNNLGLRPLEYITQKRIHAAQEHLCGSNYSIAEIAALCGYDNIHYFYRMFHKYTGCTPAAYRQSIYR